MISSLIFSFLLSPNALLIAAAIVPAALLMIYVYRKDRLEREPTALLMSLLGFGALSTVLAVVAESAGSVALAYFVPGGDESTLYNVLMFFVVVALSEEGFKYLLLHWRTWRSPHFNCRFDGVVYAVFVALGFALLENVGYVLMYGFGAALMRAITAVPGHASFGVFMGAYYGLARRSANQGQTGLSAFWRLLALLIPTLLHGMYDYIAVNETAAFSTTFILFVLIVFITSFVLVKRLSDRDEFIG